MNHLQNFIADLKRAQDQMNSLGHLGSSNLTKQLAGLNRAGLSHAFSVDPNELRGLLQLEPGEIAIRQREAAAEVNLQEVTVEDIHHDFYRAGETLLEEVKQILQNAADKDLNIKATRLKALGFTNTAEVRAHENAVANRESATRIMRRLRELKQSYPLTRFISHSDVEMLCGKYNLVFGPATSYTGTIPEDNLREIEKSLPLKAEDIFSTKLSIVAPQTDMNQPHSRREVHSIPDPIVLEPVKGGFYRIITAWGPEAKDPAVIPSYEN
jgi:hypothetical protein